MERIPHSIKQPRVKEDASTPLSPLSSSRLRLRGCARALVAPNPQVKEFQAAPSPSPSRIVPVRLSMP